MEEKKRSGMSLGSWFFVFIVLFLSFVFCFMYYKITLQLGDLIAQRNALLNTLISIETKLDFATPSTTETTETEEVSDPNVTSSTEENKLLTSEEISELSNEDGYFSLHLESIEPTDDNSYIITGYLLKKFTISDEQYSILKNGGTIEFRNRTWHLGTNEMGNEALVDVDDNNVKLPALRTENNERYINAFYAGAVGPLADFDKKVSFKVSNDILIGRYGTNFKIDENGNAVPYSTESPHEVINDFTSISFDELSGISKSISADGHIAVYVNNGIVKAIRMTGNR